MNIEKEHCDYYLEVYHWDHKLVNGVVTQERENCLGLYWALPRLGS